MAYVKPHFGNLQKRAKALAMKITRVTTDEDARRFGGHEYVLTQNHASRKRIDNAPCYTLNGIRAEIEGLEKIRGTDVPAATAVVKRVSDNFHNVSRDEIIAATVKLSSALVAKSVSVLGAMEKDCYAEHIDEVKRHHKRSMVHQIVDLIEPIIEFSEHEAATESRFGFGRSTDTHITGKLVVMRESDYHSILNTMKKLTR